jgi:hypothetical protein
MRSSRSRRMPGPRLVTQTSRSGTGPGSRTSPACWTCPAGRPGCGHRPQGAPAPGDAAAVHRPRRAPVHRVRHRRQERPAHGPGTAAPPPDPLRGPDPLRQGHRAAEPAAEGFRPQPAVVRDRRRPSADCLHGTAPVRSGGPVRPRSSETGDRGAATRRQPEHDQRGIVQDRVRPGRAGSQPDRSRVAATSMYSRLASWR